MGHVASARPFIAGLDTSGHFYSVRLSITCSELQNADTTNGCVFTAVIHNFNIKRRQPTDRNRNLQSGSK